MFSVSCLAPTNWLKLLCAVPRICFVTFVTCSTCRFRHILFYLRVRRAVDSTGYILIGSGVSMIPIFLALWLFFIMSNGAGILFLPHSRHLRRQEPARLSGPTLSLRHVARIAFIFYPCFVQLSLPFLGLIRLYDGTVGSFAKTGVQSFVNFNRLFSSSVLGYLCISHGPVV